jgi:hypothetical protein
MEHLKVEIDRDLARKLNKANPSNKDLADILRHVIDNMWTQDRLMECISSVHLSLCSNCQKGRQKNSNGDNGDGLDKKLSGKMIAVIGSLVSIIVTLVGAVVKLAMG